MNSNHDFKKILQLSWVKEKEALRFYRLIFLFGFILLVYITMAFKGWAFNVCWIKTITGIPCPTCGGTRALMAITHGDFWMAWQYNPIGYFYLLALLVGIPLLIYDLIVKQEVLFKLNTLFIQSITKTYPKVFLIGVIIINWAWNIQKGL